MRRSGQPEDWTVHLVDTGVATNTGGRLKRLAPILGRETFMATYGDGVSNVDINALVQFHRRHGKLATTTAVRPPPASAAWSSMATGSSNSPRNPRSAKAGSMAGSSCWSPTSSSISPTTRPVGNASRLERIASEGNLMAYRHEDFWQCMDTLRDLRLLEGLWTSGKAPWKVWET